MSFTVVSLFSGCGGLDIGFNEMDYDLIYACDFDKIAIECYKRNIDQRAYVRDVRETEFREDMQRLGSADVVLGGFPCQGFSKAGPKKKDDSRNLLYLEMKYAIEVLQPKIFIAENVDGLSQNFQGQYLQQITGDFKQIGYEVEHQVIDALSFGVPQHRRRIFFVGVREDLARNRFIWPAPTHQERARNGDKKYQSSLFTLCDNRINEIKPYVTIEDSIKDLIELQSAIPDHEISKKWPDEYNLIIQRIRQGQKLCNVRHANTSVYTWEIPEVFGTVNEVQKNILLTIARNRRHKKYGDIPNGNPLSIEIIEELCGIGNIIDEITDLLNKGYLKQIGQRFDLKGAMFNSGIFKRPKWNEPCQTVLTNFHNPRYFIHPLQNRPFSVRECARLQGFPDDFLFSWDDFKIPIVDRYRLIGNAVAIPVSRAMAESINRFLVDEGTVSNEILFKSIRSSRTAMGV